MKSVIAHIYNSCISDSQASELERAPQEHERAAGTAQMLAAGTAQALAVGTAQVLAVGTAQVLAVGTALALAAGTVQALAAGAAIDAKSVMVYIDNSCISNSQSSEEGRTGTAKHATDPAHHHAHMDDSGTAYEPKSYVTGPL
jgi:hypothetical protein